MGLSPPFYVFENVYNKRSFKGGEEERKRSLICANKTLSEAFPKHYLSLQVLGQLPDEPLSLSIEKQEHRYNGNKQSR